MAEPTKRGSRYRHNIMVATKRHSGSFDTKKEARAWEADLRAKAEAGELIVAVTTKHKLTDACDKYLTTVSPHKRDAVKWDTNRLNEFMAEFPGRYIEDITSEEVGEYRDRLLARVSGSTVNRYFNVFSNLFTIARKEWKWIKDNPFTYVKRPKENGSREAVWGWRDIRAVLREGQRRQGKIEEVTVAFHIALRTAMRLQEALASPAGFNPSNGTIRISKRKEDPRPITIPTTYQGGRLMQRMTPFKVEANEASTLFSKLTKQMGITGLEFKDSRATALTLMSQKMDVKTLQRISRHKDINILINCYYRETAESISARLLVTSARVGSQPLQQRY